MNCKRCGFPLSGNDQFCKNCGAAVNEISASNINTNANVNVGSFDNNLPKKEELSVNSGMNNPINNGIITPMNNQINNEMNNPINNGMNEESINSGINNGMNNEPVNNAMNNPSMNIQPNYQQPMGQPQVNQQQPINQQPRYQQPMGQPMNQIYQQPIMNQTPTKSKSSTKLIIGIIAAVLVVAIIVGVVLAFKNSNNSSNNGGNNPSVSNKSYQVTYKGFTFNVPDNLVCEERNGQLFIGDEADTWIAQIQIGKGSFAQLKSRKSQMQKLFQEKGYTASAAAEKNLGGAEYVTVELNNSGKNVLAAYARANSMYFMAIVAFNINNEYDYSILEKIAPVISQTTYAGDTNNIEADSKTDIPSIDDLAK